MCLRIQAAILRYPSIITGYGELWQQVESLKLKIAELEKAHLPKTYFKHYSENDGTSGTYHGKG